MGADFHYATFPQFTMSDDRKAELERIISGLTAEETNEFCFTMGFDCDDEESYSPTELMEDIEYSCSAQLNSREVSDIIMHDSLGCEYFANITGGMSYGDSATESVEPFNRAGYFDKIQNQCVRFAIEDCRRFFKNIP